MFKDTSQSEARLVVSNKKFIWVAVFRVTVVDAGSFTNVFLTMLYSEEMPLSFTYRWCHKHQISTKQFPTCFGLLCQTVLRKLFKTSSLKNSEV